MMKRSSLLFVGMLSLVVLTGCSWWTKKEEATTPATDVEATAAATTEDAKAEGAEAVSTINAVESSDDFKKLTDGEKPVVVKFYAEWCGACKEMEASFDEVAKTYADKCEFVVVNIDKAKDLAEAQKITGVPTVVIFKKGLELDRTTGKMTKEELEIKVKETWEEENNQ